MFALPLRGAGAMALALSLLCSVSAARAEVQVSDPWVRATVAAQKASGAFMQLQSATATRLVAVSSPVAGSCEIHKMSMQDNVMKMREIGKLDLQPGKAVALRPGGYHIMLMGLKAALKEGETVPLTLRFENADGKTETQEVRATVRAMPPAQHQH